MRDQFHFALKIVFEKVFEEEKPTKFFTSSRLAFSDVREEAGGLGFWMSEKGAVQVLTKRTCFWGAEERE